MPRTKTQSRQDVRAPDSNTGPDTGSDTHFGGDWGLEYNEYGSPKDMDAFRNEFARRINRFVADSLECWRRCEERGCRRARACRSSEIKCPAMPPFPPMSLQEWDDFRAEFYYAVKARIAELERQEADGIDQQS